ncbi:GtrA family protein [Rhodococcus sp. ARC_M6]|uniref:GtrA family protein n=1 Tax=Rhodococcus sp. ARC_M6 TaxID=2928852 RepID=UPI001FB51975|nr:GtrA family protein [Rhodococcus sp. ARC_M6]MCJ0904386.1 GtrA family protein [Rhodococcus sp. ARC_M6]
MVSPDATATPPAGMTGKPGLLMRVVKNQPLAFLLVGGINTVLGTAWFIVWQVSLGDQLGYHFAIVAGYLCNVLCAFAMYRYLVFEVRGHFLRDFWRFVIVNSGAFVVNIALMTLAVTLLHFPPIPSQLVITAVTATASFFGYRDFSFSRKKRTGTS